MGILRGMGEGSAGRGRRAVLMDWYRSHESARGRWECSACGGRRGTVGVQVDSPYSPVGAHGDEADEARATSSFSSSSRFACDVLLILVSSTSFRRRCGRALEEWIGGARGHVFSIPTHTPAPYLSLEIQRLDIVL